MTLVHLSAVDLSVAAALVLALAATSVRMRLGVAPRLVVAATRTTIQLLLIGFVLKAVFEHVHLAWVAAIGILMWLAAGREVLARQRRPFTGWWGFGLGAGSMFVSSFAVTILALVVVIGYRPWYEPQYAIPLLGMLLGNTMNGVSLSIDRLTESAWRQRTVIEQRLVLGQPREQAIADIRRESARTGLVPIMNAMAAAGLISLPGMMTGQILAGTPPTEAVRYQIMIMFLIAAGTGFGVVVAMHLAVRRLFDDRHRLRLDHLRLPAGDRR